MHKATVLNQKGCNASTRSQYIVFLAKKNDNNVQIEQEKENVIDVDPETSTSNQKVSQWLENQNFEEELRNNVLTELKPVPICKIQQSKSIDDPNIGTSRRFSKSSSDFSADDSVLDPDFLPNNKKTNNEEVNETADEEINSNEEVNETAEEGTGVNETAIEEAVNDNGENVEEIPETNKRRKTRKRIKNMDSWKRNIKKQKINSGKEYVSRLGKLHKAKSVLEACGEKCLFKCSEKVPEICREDLFNTYYKLADKSRQREFLSRHIEKKPNKPEKQYKKKTFTCAYFFNVNNEKVRVCKLFFKNTLNISNCSIDTVLKKLNESGFLEKEQRGTHSNRSNKIDENLIGDVIKHINSFPRKESHYCRSSTAREFLEGSLNLSIMYRLYKEECISNGRTFVKQHIYSNIFNTKFNLGFFEPKKDLCSVCETFNNLSGEEKESQKEYFDKHQEEKILSRLEKAKDKNLALQDEHNNIILCSYDLQAVTPLPNGNVSTFFYKSKLNVFNFTIFNIKEKSGFCYMWHEGEAKRGANEMATCVFRFLQKYGIGKTIVFYSDNCSAQNKNKHLMAMYLYTVENYDIEEITHKYLIVGHTENEGDSMHSCIEKERTRVLKNGPLYVPSELLTIVKSAKKRGKPYEVTEMSTEDFVDWKKITKIMGTNYKINEKKEKVLFNAIKIFKVKKSEPNKIFYKTSYKQKEFDIINIRKKTRSQRGNLTLIPAYDRAPPISINKKNDLISLCNDNLIPQKHHHFFRSLSASASTTTDVDSD